MSIAADGIEAFLVSIFIVRVWGDIYVQSVDVDKHEDIPHSRKIILDAVFDSLWKEGFGFEEGIDQTLTLEPRLAILLLHAL